MKISIPVLVSQTVGQEPTYTARPLFFSQPEVSGKLLERVLAKLTSAIRKELSTLSQAHRLEQLSAFSYCPNLYDQTIQLDLHHKKRSIKGSFLVVVLPEGEPRVALCPELPNLWFQLRRGEDLKARAREVLDHYFSRGPGAEAGSEFQSRSWLSEVDLSFRVPATPARSSSDPSKMILGGRPVSPGWLELERVARSLDDDYPHDLNGCLCRDAEADKLHSALQRRERTCQLLVGPRKVGKTSLIHEMVRRYRKSKKASVERRFWLLSPQRLISGMSYVGQWESRLLSILRHASKKDLVLVFDDLLGLFSAGVSRDSNLCVADVLKPYMQRGEVRVLAESTSEGMAILRERDRGFADLFSIAHLHETSERDTLTIALEEVRVGERLHLCSFELEAMTTAIDLQRRYVRDAVFPGKSAAFLRKLAARHRGQSIDRGAVVNYFHSLSGIDVRLLQDQVALDRAQVISELGEQVMGQPAAVEAAADAVIMSKARLCDPSRPVASLLFVGPTGVGKTECAKALARFLFNDEARLVRLDMNEFVSPYSAARLVGTFHQPDGLLTSAVRRRPFCVLLLDEIEKAHHEVFNLLLQVLGDGRLTDSRGRTVDFTQTIVVMTSNLGVSEASKPIGLRAKQGQEGLTYQRAVEAFFPPEFFNRLDKVVPFSQLSRFDTETLAQRLLGKLLSREGLVRRQCLLSVSPEAMSKIVDLGFHPHLGARALKRSIEHSVSGPISEFLTEMKPNAPTVISLRATPNLEVSVRELFPAARTSGASANALNQAYLDRVERYLDLVDAALQPSDDLVDEQLSAAQIWYYSVRDRLRRGRAIVAKLRGYLSSDQPVQRRLTGSSYVLQASSWDSLLESPSLARALQATTASLPVLTPEIRRHAKFAELIAELALLEGDGQEEEAELTVVFGPSDVAAGRFVFESSRQAMETLELTAVGTFGPSPSTLRLKGPHAGLLAQSQRGYHLFSEAERLGLVQVLGEDTVVRAYSKEHGTLDLRSGWMSASLPSTSDLVSMLVGSLPRPWEKAF